MPPATMILHRGARGDALAAGLADLLAAPATGDPLAPEIVAVPTRGIERWLAQQLAGRLGISPGRGDGVCANVTFPFPGRLIGEALAAATGVDPARDPWAPDRAVWPLLDVVDKQWDEPWLATLHAHLGGGGSGTGRDEPVAARRFPVLRRIADLFDRYGVHRPAMVRGWAAGQDVDGQGAALPAGARWQPELWRRLRARLAVPSPAERLEDACRALRAGPGLVEWPERLSLFGLTRLPASYLAVLDAVATARSVHLWLLHPSPALWDRERARLRGLVSAGRALVGPRERQPGPPPARNPLLATWARDAREMQAVLAEGTGAGLAGSDDRCEPVDDKPTTLLGRLQADIRADRDPPGVARPGQPDARHRLNPEDRSLQVHSCHGRIRQIEVLRDAILHLLADDPTLEPRDVIVMCPDIDTFAPLVHATFDAGDGPGPGEQPALEVRLADRSLRQTNPMLDTVAQLLQLAGSRVTASQLLDFAALPPVRRRFRFSDDDLGRVTEWVAASGIRWGLDADQREPWLLGGVDAGTWRVGLHRVLSGVAVAGEDGRLFGGVLPLDDVEGSDIELAGRVAELVDRLGNGLGAMGAPKPADEWVALLRTVTGELCETSSEDDWQRRQLHTLLDDVADDAKGPVAGGQGGTAGGQGGTPIAREELQSLLADRLRGRPTRANFRTGQLTMCTMVPMRSVPHRVVCLVGLDDGAFPRRSAPDGDDLVAHEPWIGDQDPRSEDRQLLLDALLAATGHLVITYSGRDERTNARRPPAVPVGELLDLVDRTATTGDDTGEGPVAARERIVVEHPLQPFDARNFVAGALVPDRPWGFDRVALDAAQAAVGPRRAAAPFLGRPLEPLEEAVIELDDLVAFVCHPVRAFLRRRLGVSLTGRDEEPDDALPIELDALARWTIGDRLLAAGLRGASLDAWRRAEQGRGTVAPGELGTRVLDEIVPDVRRLLAAAEAHGALGSAATLDVRTPVAGAHPPIVGTVSDVVDDTVRTVTYSKLAARHRLAGWVRLVALTAARPERPWRAVTVGRSRGLRPDVRLTGPLGGDPDRRRQQAQEALTTLVDLYRRGLREPLPLFARASAAYAEARRNGSDGMTEAKKEWETAGDFDREDREPEHVLVLDGIRPLSELCAAEPAPDECGEGWAGSEGHRFGRLARRLWDGILTAEVAVP